MRWATCTENPTVAAEHIPQNSHRLVDTKPTAALSSAPSLPTIAASIYCMSILDSCAMMAGHDSWTVSDNRWRNDSGAPDWISDSMPLG